MVLLIGIDACDLRLIERFVATGHLPFFKKLIDKRQLVETISPADVASGSTWASVNTSRNPAKHGFTFSHRQFQNGTYDIVRCYAEELSKFTFWKDISRHKKVCIFDVPYNANTDSFTGVSVSCWGVESQYTTSQSVPPSLIDELNHQYGKHPLLDWYHNTPNTDADRHWLIDQLMLGLDRRVQIIDNLLARDQWDLFYATINEIHWAGHFFSHLFEPKHPDYSAVQANIFAPRIIELYKAIDQYLAELETKVEGQPMIIFSNSGMAANFSGRHLIKDLLDRMELGAKSESTIMPAAKWGSFSAIKIEKLIGHKVISTIKKVVPIKLWNKVTRKLIYAGNNWSESKAFEIPNDYSAAIRINLEGREPKGKVSQAEYKDLCKHIADTLLALRHTKSGKPVVHDVIISRDKYRGPKIDEIADLYIVWSNEEEVYDVSSPTYGQLKGRLEDKRSGGHMPYAFLAYQNIDLQLDGPTFVEDIGPTVLDLLDETIPTDMDGVSKRKREYAV